MKKSKNIYILLAVLAVVVIGCVAAGKIEKKKENIKASGDTVLSVPTESITALSWNSDEVLAFHRDEDGSWVYDADEAFPTDDSKINALAAVFADFASDFTIEDVDDPAMYGLDKPQMTINFTADGTDYCVALGDFSQMDSERYVSIGDGRVYLAKNDPNDKFDTQLSKLIRDDTVPSLDKADELRFEGSENYTVIYSEDTDSLCADDVYFTDGKPLSTQNVGSYLSYISFLDLDEYVTYNATEQELADYGLDEPVLTLSVKYTTGDSVQQDFILHLGQNQAELEARQKAIDSKSEDIPQVTCYARVDQSQIIYKIDSASYSHLLSASYNTLRHQELFSGNLEELNAIVVTLEGETYTFTYGTAPTQETEDGESSGDKDAELKWYYNNEEIDADALKSAIKALASSGFTDDNSGEKQEIAFTLYLNNEKFPCISYGILRYNGQLCLVRTDGTATAFIDRALAVDLIEAVNAIIL